MFESGLEGAGKFLKSMMIKLLIKLTYVITKVASLYVVLVIAAYTSRSIAVTINEISDFIGCKKGRYISQNSKRACSLPPCTVSRYRLMSDF